MCKLILMFGWVIALLPAAGSSADALLEAVQNDDASAVARLIVEACKRERA